MKHAKSHLLLAAALTLSTSAAYAHAQPNTQKKYVFSAFNESHGTYLKKNFRQAKSSPEAGAVSAALKILARVDREWTNQIIDAIESDRFFFVSSKSPWWSSASIEGGRATIRLDANIRSNPDCPLGSVFKPEESKERLMNAYGGDYEDFRLALRAPVELVTVLGVIGDERFLKHADSLDLHQARIDFLFRLHLAVADASLSQLGAKKWREKQIYFNEIDYHLRTEIKRKEFLLQQRAGFQKGN